MNVDAIRVSGNANTAIADGIEKHRYKVKNKLRKSDNFAMSPRQEGAFGMPQSASNVKRNFDTIQPNTRKSKTGGKRLIRNTLAESQGDPSIAYTIKGEKADKGTKEKKIKMKKKVIKRSQSNSAQLLFKEDIIGPNVGLVSEAQIVEQ